MSPQSNGRNDASVYCLHSNMFEYQQCDIMVYIRMCIFIVTRSAQNKFHCSIDVTAYI